MARSLFAVAVLGALVACAAASRVVVEPHRGVPSMWRHAARASAETPMQLTIAIKQQNTDILEETLIRCAIAAERPPPNPYACRASVDSSLTMTPTRRCAASPTRTMKISTS